MPRYRWSHPREWLDDYISRADTPTLSIIVRELASKLDGDQVQDLYEAEMAADGYFKPVREPRPKGGARG